VLVLALTLSAFAGVAAAQDDDQGETVLRVGFLSKVDTFNPMIGLNDAAYVFYGLVYDGIHSMGQAFSTEPNLALDWNIVEDVEPYGSAWDFHMTPNAKWHDGEDVTVEDAVYTVNLNCKNYDSMWAYQPYSYFMHHAEVVDEDTMRIFFYDRATEEPKPAAYADLLPIPVLPKHKLGDHDASYIAFNWDGLFTDTDPPLIGSGPFMATPAIYDEFVAGAKLTLVRNPNYHWKVDKGLEIHFDKIVMMFYDDPVAMGLALRNGQLDVASLSPQAYRAIEQDVESGSLKNVETYDGLKCTNYWIEVGFNMNAAGPNLMRLDPAVREALSIATNKTHIVNNMYYGYALEGSTLISPLHEFWHYEPTADEEFAYDLDAAADMLEQAGYRYPNPDATVRVATSESMSVQRGWSQSGSPLKFEMLVRNEYPEEKLVAQYLKEQWALVGVEIVLDVMDELTLATEVYGYAYDTMIYFWSDDPDPNFILFCMSQASWYGWCDNLYSTPEYEENYSKSVSELDKDMRKVYSDNCQRQHYLDASYIIFAEPYQTYAWRTDTFQGWGDWEESPARSVDAFWTGNPLYFDLMPVYSEPDEPIPILYVVIGICVVAAAVAVLVLVMRRRGMKEDEYT